MQHTVEFRFTSMAPSPAAEAASRRRIRALVMAHPALDRWTVRVDSPMLRGADDAGLLVQVEARGTDGERVRAQATHPDLLAALRLGFNQVEALVDAGNREANGRAAQWLSAVRDLFPQLRGYV